METSTAVTEDIQPPKGASVWERELFDHLATHARREGQMLEIYLAEAAKTGSKALAYVINMLAEDERRHHGQMAALLRTLKHEAEFERGEPEIPRMDFEDVDTSEVLSLTRRLIADEKNDLALMKNLRKEMRDVEHTTLWAVIIDAMRLDTQKHLALLEFVEKHSRSR